ncbi:ABC transporter ATP-binding protein [Chitinophaga ginsengisegetis]|uniref:ABC transporter ATP-binding protein n=1 Tax=Chitinophaga ginsengisegetis TaxID=393003 RepID=UPI000DBA9984|nr:ABC transporter transmembrane domain-containing protein [Chitinophaga ginsengisegetis]MDR6567786.1 ABC-type multidrug transport system fused ATPase/permease subunit [Chitinophaga ginsengisegetis]MDR6647659.1 ABC-type multidrug transport system fused ATPase/permease subunit [Chitinophaga ginsengisegetis]MDR6654009.1 ABC-type multidrug transport system fused ATPase/permease subunit [Chitinophaga ginsengisegetis]
MQNDTTTPAVKQPIKVAALKKTFRLFRYVKPYWPEFSLGLVFLLISSLAGLAFPKLLGNLVDPKSNEHLFNGMNKAGVLLIGVLVAQAVFSFFRIVLFVNVTEKTLATLRQTIYSHLIRLPMKFFLERRVGELSSRISSDISLLQETFTTTLAEFIRQIIIIIGGVVILLITSPHLTIFMLAILPLMMVAAVVFGKFIRRFSKQVQEQVAASNTVVEETLQGVLNVKAFANEFFEIARYRQRTNEAARLGMKSGKFRGAFSSFIIMGIFGALVAVIWRGVSIGMPTADLLSFVLYSLFIGGSIAGLAEVYTNLQKSIGATEHLLEILDEPAEDITPVTAIAPENQLDGQISFRNVSFHYPSRPDLPVMNDVSFDVYADQKVALVGPSGAGKSTVVSLLLRLYDPVSGSILFDGKESTAFPLSQLRSQMAVVPQDVFLFGGTIAENIAYGKPGATPEEMEEAAKKANAWEFIQRFPLGLQTVVGERGIQLSGGQRQRIAIARAVLKNPRILILDEATSALDSESEKLVQDALDKLMEGRTSIVIAHRLATVRQADKIIVLDKGHIVEEGTHSELIGLDGLYRTLSDMQFAS